MPSDIPSIDDLEFEARLKRLLPAGPDAAFLDRLTAAADGTLTAPTPAELAQEAALRHIRPAPLSQDFAARLQAVVATTAFPLDEKIVLFPKASPAAKPTRSLPKIAVAAAVALLGAASALLLPETSTRTTITAGGSPAPSPIPLATAPTEFTQANFNRGFRAASDQGVLWDGVPQPQRVVRVEYLEKATFTNGQGQTVEIEQPRIEYILLPEKID